MVPLPPWCRVAVGGGGAGGLAGWAADRPGRGLDHNGAVDHRGVGQQTGRHPGMVGADPRPAIGGDGHHAAGEAEGGGAEAVQFAASCWINFRGIFDTFTLHQSAVIR